MEMITKDDLRQFRLQICDDMKTILSSNASAEDLVPEWVKSSRVRKLLDMSAGTLQTLRISGKVRHCRIGGTYYYNKEDLKNLFNQE